MQNLKRRRHERTMATEEKKPSDKLPDAEENMPKVASELVDDPDIDRVLVDAEMIEGALEQLAALMVMRMNDFGIYVPVTTGAMMFASDLMRVAYVTQRKIRSEVVRAYDRPVVQCASCSSYGDGTESGDAGEVKVELPRCDVKGKKVCIIEDIIDTGRTCMRLAAALYEAGAEEVAILALMDKSAKRDPEATKFFESKNMKIACCFMCPDEFVVGYGLDYAGKYRDLPFVGILKPEIFKSGKE